MNPAYNAIYECHNEECCTSQFGGRTNWTKNTCPSCHQPGVLYRTFDDEEEKEKEYESIHHPPHYGGDTTYETVKVLEHWMTPIEFRAWCRGNTIKYLSRQGKKPTAEAIEDLRKAAWYLNREIQNLERKQYEN